MVRSPGVAKRQFTRAVFRFRCIALTPESRSVPNDFLSDVVLHHPSNPSFPSVNTSASFHQFLGLALV